VEPSAAAVPNGRLVPRPHLIGRLIAARESALAMIVAPAGYGKSTLLAEWAEHDERPFAWVELETRDNHPVHLIGTLADALGEVGALSSGPLDLISDIASARLTLRQAVQRSLGPFVLVIDDADSLSEPAALDVLAMLIEHLPTGSQLALASRREPALPIGSLRARRKLSELRSADLVMTRHEAAWLASLSGLELDDAGLDLLVRRTEGWPAGLYLAALAVRGERDPTAALAGFSGEDRTVVDYLGEELLARLAPEEIAFLMRSSVLDRLSGPLCDYVLERQGSARLLRTLSRSNVLLVPLDRTDTEYRYHRLFAQTLRGELRRSGPELERAIHTRASDWHAQHGDADGAILHAISSGDVPLAGRLLWRHAGDYVSSGRNARVRDWLGRLTDRQIAGCPELAVSAAASELVMGDRDLVERWLSAAARTLDFEPHPDAASIRATISVLAAAVAGDDIGRIAEQAARAYDAEADDSPWRALACLIQGVAQHLTGEDGPARERLEEGARRGAVVAPAFQVLCLSQLALLAIDRADWDAAELLAARAKGQVERVGLTEYALSALVYAVSSEVQARIGRVDAAQRDGRDATRLLSALTRFTPWYEAECRIALARASLRLSDVATARALLSEAARDLNRSQGAQVARRWLEECSSQTDVAAQAQADGTWSLTTAELRVLQFLPTHLSFPEIAERLYVSANTVKTHTRSVYRKLDASSRGEAVVRAREAGLLDTIG
jgi:LuxR family transcriptional regulator, maltose regulon positive regulatory protein